MANLVPKSRETIEKENLNLLGLLQSRTRPGSRVPTDQLSPPSPRPGTAPREIESGGSSDSDSGSSASSYSPAPASPRPSLMPANVPTPPVSTSTSPFQMIRFTHESGPNKPLPPHLLRMLEDWHRQKGLRLTPPCKYGNNRLTTQKSKVFNEDGVKMELSGYLISRPCSYRVLVLHDEHGVEKLVACANRFGGSNTILKAWMGADHLEPDICAIRVFGVDERSIVFSPALFERARTTIQSSSTTTATYHAPDTRRTRPDQEGDEHSEENGVELLRLPHLKRRKTLTDNQAATATQQDNADNNATGNGDIIFKLVSKTNATFRVPLKGCSGSKDLFSKARRFFRVFDESAKVAMLSCQLPSHNSQSEEQYIFDGGDMEFDLLIADAKRELQRAKDGILNIVVKCVD